MIFWFNKSFGSFLTYKPQCSSSVVGFGKNFIVKVDRPHTSDRLQPAGNIILNGEIPLALIAAISLSALKRPKAIKEEKSTAIGTLSAAIQARLTPLFKYNPNLQAFRQNAIHDLNKKLDQKDEGD